MSTPRPTFKNVTLMLTRRVRGRQFLLRPSARTGRIVGYVAEAEFSDNASLPDA